MLCKISQTVNDGRYIFLSCIFYVLKRDVWKSLELKLANSSNDSAVLSFLSDFLHRREGEWSFKRQDNFDVISMIGGKHTFMI